MLINKNVISSILDFILYNNFAMLQHKKDIAVQ